MSSHLENLALNYVYTPAGTDELRSVRVAMRPDTDEGKLEVNIESEGDISKQDLEGILNTLQKERFGKIRIDLVSDCKIKAAILGEIYALTISQDVQAGKISLDELTKL